MTNVMPEWRKMWKLDDSTWVTEREQAWLKVKKSPVFKYHYKKDYVELIKNFFMTGSAYYPIPPQEDWRWFRYHPDTKPVPVANSLLIQCWLSPEVNLDYWNNYKEDQDPNVAKTYGRTRYFFRNCLMEYFDQDLNLFSGREVELFLFFTSELIGDELTPNPDVEQKQAYLSYGQLRCFIESRLNNDLRVIKLADVMLEEWSNSIVNAYQYNSKTDFKERQIPQLLRFIRLAFSHIESQEDEPLKNFSKRLISNLKKHDYPPEMEGVLNALDN